MNKPKVLLSLENAQGDRCVDIFERPDGSFGFEEFRRDVEDRGLWLRLNLHASRVFASQAEALSAARVSVTWLAVEAGVPVAQRP